MDDNFGDKRFEDTATKNLPKANKSSQASRAAGDLRAAESEAGADGVLAKANADVASANRNETRGFYRGVGKQDNGKKKEKAKGKGLSRKLSVGFIISLIFGGGALAFLSQTMAPFSYMANLMDQYNITRTVFYRRSNYMTRLQLDSSRNKSLTTTPTIFTNEKFKISKSLRQKLAKNGIDYVETEGNDGKKLRLLTYNDPDTNERIAIVANDNDTARVPFDIDVGGEKVKLTQVRQLDVALDELPEFSKGVDLSTRTLRGHIAGWFTDTSEEFHARIHNSRNTFAGVSDDASGEEVQAAAKGKGIDLDIDNTGNKEYETDLHEETIEEDGVEKTVVSGTPAVNADDDSITGRKTVPEIETALSTRVKKAAASAGGVTCAVANGLNAINKVTSAIMVASVINFGVKVFEAIQKAQAGDGGAAMMYFMNGFNQKGNTTGLDSEGNEVVVAENVNAMSSPAWNATFGAGDLSASDPIAKKYNQEYMTSFAFSNAGVNPGVAAALVTLSSSRDTYVACNAFRGVMSVVSLVATIFPPAKGVAEAGKKVWDVVIQTAVTALGFVIAIAAPRIARSIAIDLVGNMSGSDAAYALRAAGNRYMGGQMQANTGMPGTRSQVLAMYRETQDVIAKEAEFERSIKSPFDITSQNTFLGSLVYKLTPLGLNLGSSASIISSISSLSNITKESAIALIPAVNAINDETQFGLTLNSDCPSLTSLNENLVADAFCTPYYSMDMSTMAMDPADVYTAVGAENFDGEDENGNPKIKKDSEFSNWIKACTQRDSVWGTVDQVIQSGLTTYTTVPSTGNADADALINTGVNYIPVVDDIADIAQVTDSFINYKWNTGEACLDEKSKYYAQYTVDQNILEIESNGEIKSSVAAVLNDYYQENPLDDSYEGTIARYSGMTIDEVNDALALMDYYNYIMEYDASTRYAFGAPVVEKSQEILFDNENVIADVYVVLLNEISFADVRNRTALV